MSVTAPSAEYPSLSHLHHYRLYYCCEEVEPNRLYMGETLQPQVGEERHICATVGARCLVDSEANIRDVEALDSPLCAVHHHASHDLRHAGGSRRIRLDRCCNYRGGNRRQSICENDTGLLKFEILYQLLKLTIGHI